MFIKLNRKGNTSEYRINVDLIKYYFPAGDGTMLYFTDALGQFEVTDHISVIDKLLGVKDASRNVDTTVPGTTAKV